MILTDGKKTVIIRMCIWEGNGYSPDWSNDFFDAGSLPYNESKGAYIVKDVDYCIDQAHDWEKSEGDFSEDQPNVNNTVFVEEL